MRFDQAVLICLAKIQTSVRQHDCPHTASSQTSGNAGDIRRLIPLFLYKKCATSRGVRGAHSNCNDRVQESSLSWRLAIKSASVIKRLPWFSCRHSTSEHPTGGFRPGADVHCRVFGSADDAPVPANLAFINNWARRFLPSSKGTDIAISAIY